MADRPTSAGGLNWGARPKTPQVRGRDTEARLLKERGARVHPMSGAGSIKEDGSDEHTLYEVKETRRSFSLRGVDLAGTFKRAVRQGKTGVWLIYFSDIDMVVECRMIPGGRSLLGGIDGDMQARPPVD